MIQAIYDLSKFPTTYDFAAWAVVARTHGHDSVHFIADKPIAAWKYGGDETIAWKRWANIVLPICKLARLSYTVGERIPGREFNYHGGHVNKLYREKGAIVKLKPTLKVAERGYVTITLRESFRNAYRNSNLEAWSKFRSYLREKGIETIVFPECESTPIDVEQRMAWYCGADINMGVAQGPMALCIFSDAPYITLNQNPKDETGQAQYDINSLLVKTGFPPGSQYEFRTARQLLVWEPDTLDNIVQAYEGMCERKKEAA